jgi:hypothetical protein
MSDPTPDPQIKRWELNTVIVELVVLAGITSGVAVGFLSHVQSLARVPVYVLNAIGFALLGILLIPAQSILFRVYRQQRRTSPITSVVWCVVAAGVYAVIARLMQ